MSTVTLTTQTVSTFILNEDAETNGVLTVVYNADGTVTTTLDPTAGAAAVVTFTGAGWTAFEQKLRSL
jgi:flagellar hook assembly protein FlgD